MTNYGAGAVQEVSESPTNQSVSGFIPSSNRDTWTWGTLVRKSCIAPDEQVSTLHWRLLHQCMNVSMNGWI